MAYIDDLVSIGADAMTNLFDVELTLPIPGADDRAFRLRVKNFTPPEFKLKTYSVKYKTVSIQKPAAEITGDRTFQLTFRVDANYDVYKQLLAWRALYYNESTGYATHTPAPSSLQGIVKVKAFQGDVVSANRAEGVYEGAIGSTDIIWTFQNVWISSLTPPSYTTGDGNAAEVTAEFHFGSHKAPDRLL